MLTIGIKTFCRPHTLNESLTNIIYKNDEKYHIIIADDSLPQLKEENLKVIDKFKNINKNITVIDLPFDSGLSVGRNTIVSKCTTKYIMILDDSRSFTNDLNVSNMIKFLETNENFHLFSGVINERHGINRKYARLFDSIEKIKDVIYVKTKPTRKLQSDFFKTIEESNIGLNVFVAKTECLRNVKWNECFKLGEHQIFFYDFYNYGYKCVVSEDCVFTQAKNIKYYGDMKKYRERAYNIFRPVQIEMA